LLNPQIIWQEYTKGKQTYQQLSEKYNCSKRTIQRKIDLHNLAFVTYCRPPIQSVICEL